MNWIHKAILYVKEAYNELKKVSWLGKKEVIASTVVVLMLIVIVAIYVGTIDFILVKIFGVLLHALR
jgi:preprotein translocase subunit SecE